MAGNHYVKHTVPNAKPNPYAMPWMASNTNECTAKNGWLQNLFSSQQASTAGQWSMSLWLASCCMASWIPKSPCCSGAEQKMVPAALGQWDHNITPGWLLALHQALNVGVIQWRFHNFWACLRMGHSPSFVGLAIGFIILATLVLVRHGAQLQPCFIPLGNEILEARMVGKGCVHLILVPQKSWLSW